VCICLCVCVWAGLAEGNSWYLEGELEGGWCLWEEAVEENLKLSAEIHLFPMLV
jgi:hypothetical protein